jgi:hypothetical protein
VPQEKEARGAGMITVLIVAGVVIVLLVVVLSPIGDTPDDPYSPGEWD